VRESERARERATESNSGLERVRYGVATMSRLPTNIGLFYTKVLSKRPYSAKETYILKEPTNHSHLIVVECEIARESVCLCVRAHAPHFRGYQSCGQTWQCLLGI